MNLNWGKIKSEIGQISKLPAGRALIQVLLWGIVICAGVIIYQNWNLQSCNDEKVKAVRACGYAVSKCEAQKLAMQREFGDSVKAFYIQRDKEKTEEFRQTIAELKAQVAAAAERTDRAILHSTKTERNLNRIDIRASKIFHNASK